MTTRLQAHLCHTPHASLWSPVSKKRVRRKLHGETRPASSLCWGPSGHNTRSAAGVWELHVIWTLSCKYVQNLLEVPSRGESKNKNTHKKSKSLANPAMAYRSLQLWASISVKLGNFCSFTPGFLHPRDLGLLKALRCSVFTMAYQFVITRNTCVSADQGGADRWAPKDDWVHRQMNG